MRKKFKEQFDLINSKLDKLLGDTAKKAEKYENYVKQLKNISIKAEKIRILREQNGSFSLNFDLKIPSINLQFDDNNEVVANPQLIALNELRLLSVEDIQKISEMLGQVALKNKIERM